MEGEQILIQSRYVDRLLIKYYKSKNAAIKKELKAAQDDLDRMVLGRKLKQDEIDEQIRGMEKWVSI